jgi:transposase-like protein
MTYREDFTLPAELMERVSKQGFDILSELIQVIINAAMQAERQQYLKAEPYQHTEEREGHANGYKPKTVHTRVGNITFAIPQVREGGFYPEALEKGLRSEQALLLALAEMYVQGVSTRKVKVVAYLPRRTNDISHTYLVHHASRSQISSRLAALVRILGCFLPCLYEGRKRYSSARARASALLAGIVAPFPSM